jgi:hypothetical protein
MSNPKNIWDAMAIQANAEVLPALAAETLKTWERSPQTPEIARRMIAPVEALLSAYDVIGLEVPEDIADKFGEILTVAQAEQFPLFGRLDMSLNSPGKGFGGPGVS